MKRIFLPLFALLILSCAKDVSNALTDDVPQDAVEQEESSILQGEANVYLSEEMADLVEKDLGKGSLVTKSSPLNSLLESLGASSMTRIFPYAGEFEPRTRQEGLHRWYTVKFDKEVPVTKACSDFTALPGVELVEPVRRARSQAFFNDPKLSRQWHYYNDGSLNSSFKAGADINVYPVWENYTVGNPDVIVAIVDGGIDYTHEDLAGNYCGGYNFIRNNSVVIPHNHGTHVAGTVAAVNNNGKGVCGIAGGDAAAGKKGVGLLSCQIFEPNPSNPKKDISGGMPSAIKWGADQGAVISQNSWGYVYDTAEEQAAATIDTPLKNAIDYFIKYAGIDASGNQTGPMRGGVVFFAAGNDTREHDPIGKYDPVISVGSIGPDYTRAYYSNYGDWVDIAAPGGSVKYPSGTVLSTVPGNGYEGYQGTSMACPHVSGVAALVVSHFGGPGFTNQMLKDKILKGANTDALSMNARIGPLLDALGAMTYGGTKPPVAVTSYSAEPYSNNIRFSWKVTSDPDDKSAFGFVLAASRDADAIRNLDLRAIPSNVVTRVVMTDGLKVGDDISADLTGLEFESEYFVTLAAFDYNRNYSSLAPVKTLRTLSNSKPVIQTDYDGDFQVKAYQEFVILYDIHDPDNHSVTVNFIPGSKAASLNRNPDGKYRLEILGYADDPGTYQAVISVSDSYGASEERKITYRILENQAPVVIKKIENKILDYEGEKFTLDMTEYINDPDDEPLKYSISISDRSVLHINPKDNLMYATVLSFGAAEVVITATDAKGLSCKLSFKVLARDSEIGQVDAYPNPVTDFLNVSTSEETTARIRLLSPTGKSLLDKEFEISAFDPASVDMRKCAPGIYTLIVEYDGNEYRRTVTKI